MNFQGKSKEQLFIQDLVRALLEDAKIAQTNLIKNQETPGARFDAGVVQGYWQVFTSLVSRMEIYDLDLAEYGLEAYDPDSIWDKIRENFLSKKKTPDGDSPH